MRNQPANIGKVKTERFLNLKRILVAPLVTLAALFFLCWQPTFADEPSAPGISGQLQSQKDSQAEEGLFNFKPNTPNSFEESVKQRWPNPILIRGERAQWWRHQPKIDSEDAMEKLRTRPLLYWRYFAERPPHPIRMLVTFLFFNILIGLVFNQRVSTAAECVRKSFWKSLGMGMLVVLLMSSITRIGFDTELLVPMARMNMGLLQMLCVCGLAVCARVLGESLLRKLRIAQPKNGELATTAQCCVWLVTGTVLIALIAYLPPLHIGQAVLPRIGTRIAMWLSMLGLGALIRTKLGTTSLSK